MHWRPCTQRHTSGEAVVVFLDSTTISNYLHRIVQVKQVTGQISDIDMTQSLQKDKLLIPTVCPTHQVMEGQVTYISILSAPPTCISIYAYIS